MSDEATPQPARWANSAPPGRTTDGRFGSGNSAARGNPNARRMSELRKQILAATTEEKVNQVMDALFTEAVKGDVPACTTWLKYTVGPPPQAIELTTGDPIQVDMTSLTQVVLAALSDHPDARVAVAAALRANRLEPPEGGHDGPAD